MHSGGAVVVPVTAEGKIVFVRQYRYPLNEFLFELPAGKLFHGEDPLICAIRELKEETGYSAGKVEKLGSIATTPGFCTEILHIFYAHELKPGDHDREEGEFGMESFEFSLDEIDRMIKDNRIIDGKSLSGLLLYKTKIL